MTPLTYTLGQRVKVWIDGFDQWLMGEVEQVGQLQGVDVARVHLDGKGDGTFRFDQMATEEGLFGL
jgi:hypothetical protein